MIHLVSSKQSPRQTEFVQLFDYLKCRNDRLGLLVNMGLDRVHVERVAYERPETRLEENWSYWSGRISGRARDVGISVRDALRAIYHEHETGYGAQVTEKLILFALQSYQLNVTAFHPWVRSAIRGPSTIRGRSGKWLEPPFHAT